LSFVDAPVAAGQLTEGGVVSATVTSAVHEVDAFLLSVTVSVTVVAPTEYGPAGVWTIEI